MRSRLRGWFVVLTLAAPLVATATGADKTGADKTPSAGDAVSLAFREPKNVSDVEAPPPFFARELVRQAFLIAARDECGLRTRDATLREGLLDSPAIHVVPFEIFAKVVRIKQGFDVRYTLSRQKGTTTEKLEEWTFLTDVFSPKMITDLADVAERMSRGKFKNLLREQGLQKPVPAAHESAGVPRETAEQLWEWNEIAVLGAVRRIHAEIRAKGESPELLAGLTIGYANLGTLTACYFSPAHKAFSARALLYAERLLRESKGSDWALWHRAYVRAILGLHEQARVDVKAARKLWDKTSSKRPPFWADVVQEFCDGNLPQMLEKAKSRDQRRLARYLNLQAVIYYDLHSVTIAAAEAMLQECPDCLRAADALCSQFEIGPMRMVTETAFPQFSKTLRKRLPDFDGFPASLSKRVTDAKPADDATQENPHEDAIEFRVQLVADIKAETTSGRDTSEPSLSVLGAIIDEIQFLQVVRRLELEQFIWGIPTGPTIAAYGPLCASHPYGALIDSFSDAIADVAKGVLTLVRVVNPSELGSVESWVLNRFRQRSAEPATTWLRIAWSHSDPVWSDEMYGIGQGMAGTPDERKYNKPYMDTMWQTSARLPAALAIQINRNWKKAKLFSATVEHDFANDPIVMAALANRYSKLKQLDDAERCAKQRIKASPDYGGYRVLASIYQQKGEAERWKDTLVKSLDLPSPGLEQASVRDQIAHYYMKRNEWSEAAAYADAAAESYSAWSMITACRCHEMLGEWEKAEAYIHATSERYEDSSFDWMVWCYRTGHGDKDAADACARKHFESLGTNFNAFTRQQVAIYYLLRKEPEKALALFDECFKKGHAAYDAVHAMTIADTLGKTAERDADIAKILAEDPAKDSHGAVSAGIYKELVKLLQKALPPGSVKDIDFKTLDAVINKAPNSEAPTNPQYFVGMFLKNRGDTEKSREYLIRCAQSDLIVKYTHVLARRMLRDLKIPLPPHSVAKSSKPDR